MTLLRKYWFLLIIPLIIIMLALTLKTQKALTTNLQDHQKTSIQIGRQLLNVEIVNTPASMSKGLGDRTQIGSDGMLFVLPNRQKAPFWMKDMQISLDFVWIENGQVVQINENVKAPKNAVENEDQNLSVLIPNQTVDLVLELPAGNVQNRAIKVGDKVLFN